MVDIKISQLSNVASNELTDLFEISRSTGAATWESRSITYHDVLHSVVGERVVTVGNVGAMETTIEAAIQHVINELAPSSTDPAVILVQAGVYTENNPLAIPDYVSVISLGDQNTTYVLAANPTSPIFSMGSYSSLRGFYMENASGVGGVAVKGTGVGCLVESCASSNCETAFWATTSTSNMRCIDCAVINTPGQTCIYGFRSDNEGALIVEQSVVTATSFSLVTYGFYCEGNNSTMEIPTFFSLFCVNGVYADNGAEIEGKSGEIRNCTNAMVIGSNGSNTVIKLFATTTRYSSAYSVLIQSSTGQIDFMGRTNYNKRSIVNGGEFNSLGIDRDNEILKLTGKTNSEETLDVGVPGAYTEGYSTGLDVGEGGSYDVDNYGNEIVEYWKYDDSAVSGSKFTRYADNAGTQLMAEDDAIIVASKYPFSATRMDVTTAANVGSNSFVAEHWDGSAWVSDAICGYNKSDLTHRGTTIFQNVETQYIEFGTGINDDWVSDRNVLNQVPDWDNGIDMYPIRFRNNGGSLVTAMQFEDGKVRGDDFDVTEAKKIVVWGRFRQQVNELVKVGELSPSSLYPPSNETIQISPNIASNVSSRLIDGSVCATGFAIVSPDWIDTSSGVRLIVSMYPSNSAAGNVEIKVRYLPLLAGFVFDGTATEYSQSIVVASPGVEKQVFIATYLFDISSFAPNMIFFVSIERDATAGNPLDTYAGDVVITGLKVVWTRKRFG